MELNPRYSFVIPVYNTEKYIEKCVSSLQKQTYKNIEIILVDDGSSDHSLQVCKKLADGDHRIIVLHQENKGPGIARNRGVDAARGDFIIFCDSDDWWNTDDALLKINGQIERDLNIDLIVLNAVCTYDNGRTLEPETAFRFFDKIPLEYENGKNYLQTVLCENYNYIWCAWLYVFRRSVILKSGARFPANRLNEDKAVIYQYILEAEKVYVLNEYVYVYRKSRAGSCTCQESLEKLSGILDVSKKCIEQVEARKDLSESLKRMLCNNFAVEYFIAMIRMNRLPVSEQKQLLQVLKKEKYIMEYAYSVRQVFVRRMVKILGFRTTIWLLGIRRNIQEKGRHN